MLSDDLMYTILKNNYNFLNAVNNAVNMSAPQETTHSLPGKKIPFEPAVRDWDPPDPPVRTRLTN